MKYWSLILLLLLIGMPVVAQESTEEPSELAIAALTPEQWCEVSTPAQDPLNRTFDAPEQVLEDGVDYSVVLCTSAGAVYINLFEDITPTTVNNFVFLAEQGYYNNTVFHRVLEDFMAQAGDPTATGRGGPGYTFGDEIVPYLQFDRTGLLAMANAGPGTNGSQFFVTTAETPWLNGAHTIFGEVVTGYDAVLDLNLRNPATGQGELDPSNLETVVVIDDPASVAVDVEPVPVATAETFIDGLSFLSADGSMPSDMTVNSGEILSTDDVVAIAPEDLADDYATLLADNGHDYRVSASVGNAECNEQYFIVDLVYSVNAFTDEASASAVQESEFLVDYYTAVGYEPIETTSGVTAYSSEVSICAEGEVAITLDVQRGRYLVNVSVVYPQGLVEAYTLDELVNITVNELITIFEQGLSEAYRSEL